MVGRAAERRRAQYDKSIAVSETIPYTASIPMSLFFMEKGNLKSMLCAVDLEMG